MPPELLAEVLSVAPGPTAGERVYVMDLALNHTTASRVRVLEARSGLTQT